MRNLLPPVCGLDLRPYRPANTGNKHIAFKENVIDPSSLERPERTYFLSTAPMNISSLRLIADFDGHTVSLYDRLFTARGGPRAGLILRLYKQE